jgi:hypothetical protein
MVFQGVQAVRQFLQQGRHSENSLAFRTVLARTRLRIRYRCAVLWRRIEPGMKRHGQMVPNSRAHPSMSGYFAAAADIMLATGPG